ncbi:protein arginine N-methyltransferase 5 [Belonocnema kinseyi]|uniref:protein arginine N-methyltransferase 5 n=1 Tax=Belonocnema kinseyi TaxID=2817044 RepID=UPI00143DA44F|nr:protein arginine N-methyltransferase 5 [Belonocnema kinseyi]XP_033223877.1 protein arginine N-methyltransferase 5 [Belonocnema kinseyi]
MSGERRSSCGLEFSAVPDLKQCLCVANEAKYDFIVAPLVHPRYKREFISGVAKERTDPFTRPDMILCNSDWNSLVIGKFSPHIDVDSPIPYVAKNSEEALNQEFCLASHLALTAVTLKLKGNIDRHINLARIVADKLASPVNCQVWLQVPMENPQNRVNSYRDEEHFSEVETETPWEWWNAFRIICDFDRKLGAALFVSHDLPEEDEISRWLGEPVKCLILPTTLFISNKKGFPVLGRAHQMLVKRFCSLDVQFIITGANRYRNISYYYHYLDYIWKSWQNDGPIERYARGYEDCLQCPLQPLMDNLESGTYEVFEKDPVKYSQYQLAIYQALLHKDAANNKKDENEELRPVIIMVVGAGRGPLVRAALNASETARVPVKIYAVEKNPNAVLTLQALQKEMWMDKVTVVSSDMREWVAPEKADILVSELLGSFGDNELSPECLDGVQRHLKSDGISIPRSYTSYIAPVQSSKLFNEVKQCKDKEKHPLTHFETPYVVHLQNKYDIAPTQPLFTFEHPNRNNIIDNSRYEMRKFSVQQNSILHGFSGYFDAVLYEDVMLSIEPRSHSPGMISWFPIFFPLKESIYLKAEDEICAHFWRRCNAKNVWYEWSVSKPVAIAIHNPNGRSYTIGL